MEARYFAWTFCVFVLANIVSVAEGHTCTYGGNKYLDCENDEICCGSYNDRYCCNAIGMIAGILVGSVVLVIIGASIIACCCCACCPVYQYRNRDTPITTSTAIKYQTMP